MPALAGPNKCKQGRCKGQGRGSQSVRRSTRSTDGSRVILTEPQEHPRAASYTSQLALRDTSSRPIWRHLFLCGQTRQKAAAASRLAREVIGPRRLYDGAVKRERRAREPLPTLVVNSGGKCLGSKTDRRIDWQRLARTMGRMKPGQATTRIMAAAAHQLATGPSLVGQTLPKHSRSSAQSHSDSHRHLIWLFCSLPPLHGTYLLSYIAIAIKRKILLDGTCTHHPARPTQVPAVLHSPSPKAWNAIRKVRVPFSELLQDTGFDARGTALATTWPCQPTPPAYQAT